jgi:antirestriction protein ArdC
MVERHRPMRDSYQEITDRIANAIEAGAGKWQMPWHAIAEAGSPFNAVTKRFYRGVNVLTLAMTAQALTYPTNGWASYRQWDGVGAQVRKGEHGQVVCYYGASQVPAPDGAPPAGTLGGDEQRTIRWLKFSTVFNRAQVDNAPEVVAQTVAKPAEIIARAEQFVDASGAKIKYGQGKAAYSPSLDTILMPDRKSFKATKGGSSATENYYGVLCHELVHWSGAAHRLNRELSLKRFNDATYAMEELVAELGSAFVNADLGIRPTPRPDNAAYVATWLKVLKSDKRAIFTAASKASAAAEYLGKLADIEHEQEAA